MVSQISFFRVFPRGNPFQGSFTTYFPPFFDFNIQWASVGKISYTPKTSFLVQNHGFSGQFAYKQPIFFCQFLSQNYNFRTASICRFQKWQIFKFKFSYRIGLRGIYRSIFAQCAPLVDKFMYYHRYLATTSPCLSTQLMNGP